MPTVEALAETLQCLSVDEALSPNQCQGNPLSLSLFPTLLTFSLFLSVFLSLSLSFSVLTHYQFFSLSTELFLSYCHLALVNSLLTEAFRQPSLTGICGVKRAYFTHKYLIAGTWKPTFPCRKV